MVPVIRRLSLTLSLLLPAAAGAQPAHPCAEREQILQVLTDRYGETIRSMGLAGTTRMVELFASDETGSWTITVTTPDGVTCLLASGNAFEAITALPGRNDA